MLPFTIEGVFTDLRAHRMNLPVLVKVHTVLEAFNGRDFTTPAFTIGDDYGCLDAGQMSRFNITFNIIV